MKLIILFILSIFYSGPSSAYYREINQYCLCYRDVKDDGALGLPIEGWQGCTEGIMSSYEEYERTGSDLHRILESKTAFCSKKQMRDWYKKYRKKNQEAAKNLKEDILKKICGQTGDAPKKENEKCFDTLFAMTSESEFKTDCDKDALNKKNKDVKLCVEERRMEKILETVRDETKSKGIKLISRACSEVSFDLKCFKDILASKKMSCLKPELNIGWGEVSCYTLALWDELNKLEEEKFVSCLDKNVKSNRADCLLNNKDDISKELEEHLKKTFQNYYGSKP